MPSFVQRSFAGGEISPAVYGRADQAKYATGLKTCRNFMVQRFGGIQNRPGLEFIAPVKDPANIPRLIPFIFNDEQTYVLEVGKLSGTTYGALATGYMRIYRLGVWLPVSGTTWSSLTAYVKGNIVEHSGVKYYCLADHTSQEPPNVAFWYAMPAGGIEIPTTWPIDDNYILKYAQSGDTVIFTSPSAEPKRLVRVSAYTWYLQDMTWAPSIAAPTGVAVNGTAGTNTYWAITSIEKNTLHESLISAEVGGNSDASTGTPRTVSWTAQPAAQEFVVYKKINGVWGFIGLAQGTSFTDTGFTPDTSLQPPTNRDLDGVIGDPAVVAFHQQRLMFGGGNTNPERIVASRIGDYTNLGIHSPLQSDDSITVNIAGKKVSEIRGMVPMGQALVVLTASAEYTINGDSQGVLTPSTINISPQAYSGSSWLDPLTVQDTALFVQARGSLVRDLQYEFSTDGYRGRDLTVYAQHLVDGFTIVDWTYAQTPQSIVWAVRNDGILLGLTYVREHDVWGWHRHDTDGLFMRTCSVPEGNEDRAYFVVQRTVDGNTVAYIERMASRKVADTSTEARFLDSHLFGEYPAYLVYGRPAELPFKPIPIPATSMTLTGGTTWEFDDLLTLTASAARFDTVSLGDEVRLVVGGETMRMLIMDIVSDTVVTVSGHRTVPTAFRNVAISDWTIARKTWAGLDHLEGKTIGVLGDGFVAPDVTVSGGQVVLDRAYAKVCMGLHYNSDMQTLAIENTQGETLIDKRKRVKGVTVLTQETRGFFAGTDFNSLYLRESKLRAGEGYDDPISPVTGSIEVLLSSSWDDNGSIAIRNSDPLPVTILAVVPSGIVTGE